MRTRRYRVPSFLCLVCLAAVLAQPRRAFAIQDQPPQTQEQVQARDALNQGVQAFKNGQVDEANRFFERARQLDPSLLNARLFLANSYASQYIPGAASEENKRLAQRAIEEYKSVLQFDAQNLSAIDGLRSLLFQMAGTPPVDVELFKQSKAFHEKHIQINPRDPEPHYWIGVIDWTLAFRANGELREKYNESLGAEKLLDSDSPPPFLQVRYASEWEFTIDEGIESMKKALAFRPDYDDAMAYLNLLYRRKADTAGTQYEREQLIKIADDLVERVKEIKQKRVSSQPQ